MSLENLLTYSHVHYWSTSGAQSRQMPFCSSNLSDAATTPVKSSSLHQQDPLHA